MSNENHTPGPLKPHILDNIEARARTDLAEGHQSAPSRLPAHMLLSLVTEVREFRAQNDDLPAGYRWATGEETEMDGGRLKLPGAILVKRTLDSSGKPYTEGEADVAVPITSSVDAPGTP